MGKPKSVVYQDKKKEWRFRLVAGNGKIIAVSSEGYYSERNCQDALWLVDTCDWYEYS